MAALRLIVNPLDPVSRKELAGELPALQSRLDDLRAVVASRGIEPAIDEIKNGLVPFDTGVPEIALADEAIGRARGSTETTSPLSWRIFPSSRGKAKGPARWSG